MSISWNQVENGSSLRSKIMAYADPKFNHIEQFTPTNKQTAFNLTYKPTDDIVKLMVNGLTYYETIHFNVNRTTKVPKITWTYTKANGGYDIASTDLVAVDYWSFTPA